MGSERRIGDQAGNVTTKTEKRLLQRRSHYIVPEEIKRGSDYAKEPITSFASCFNSGDYENARRHTKNIITINPEQGYSYLIQTYRLQIKLIQDQISGLEKLASSDRGQIESLRGELRSALIEVIEIISKLRTGNILISPEIFNEIYRHKYDYLINNDPGYAIGAVGAALDLMENDYPDGLNLLRAALNKSRENPRIDYNADYDREFSSSLNVQLFDQAINMAKFIIRLGHPNGYIKLKLALIAKFDISMCQNESNFRDFEKVEVNYHEALKWGCEIKTTDMGRFEELQHNNLRFKKVVSELELILKNKTIKDLIRPTFVSYLQNRELIVYNKVADRSSIENTCQEILSVIIEHYPPSKNERGYNIPKNVAEMFYTHLFETGPKV